ncbi:tetratricopeptide repeat protein [Microbacterium deminutum]|uniref:Tetratricopeptide repeat protein n=1 Tax=Microbacterium deminutum TaxID=344164 RepID=A0ABP5CLC9_9MICO
MLTWDERIDAVWRDGSLTDLERIERIDALAAERGDDARALFERAGARDSAGVETEGEPLYRQALAAGLDDEHRTQAVIQLASTLRNLGRTEEALGMLRAEYERGPSAPLHDAAAAFYVLALVSGGDAVAAASIALKALAPHLPRYSRSVAAYANDLLRDRD